MTGKEIGRLSIVRRLRDGQVDTHTSDSSDMAGPGNAADGERSDRGGSRGATVYHPRAFSANALSSDLSLLAVRVRIRLPAVISHSFFDAQHLLDGVVIVLRVIP